jgi:hypothetical protein
MVCFRVQQASGSNGGHILNVNPAPPGRADVMPDDAFLDLALPAVAQHVLHKDLGPQVREGESAPFDVSLDKLVPAIVRHAGVVIAAGAKVDKVLHASLFGDVEKVFALAHHVDCIARGEKGPINALERRRDRLGLVEIEIDHRNAEVFRLFRRTRRRDDFDVPIGNELGDNALADLAGCA